MSEFFDSLPYSVQARASRRIGGLARTLRNWEYSFVDDEVARKAFYVSGFIDRLEAPPGPLISDMGKESLIGLVETLTALHDTDGKMCVRGGEGGDVPPKLFLLILVLLLLLPLTVYFKSRILICTISHFGFAYSVA